jgi:hypothetical protein
MGLEVFAFRRLSGKQKSHFFASFASLRWGWRGMFHRKGAKNAEGLFLSFGAEAPPNENRSWPF